MPNHSKRRKTMSAKPGGKKRGSGWRNSGPKGKAGWRSRS